MMTSVGIVLRRCACGRVSAGERCRRCAEEVAELESIAALESAAAQRELESLLPWPTRMRRIAGRALRWLWIPMLAFALIVLLWLGASLMAAVVELQAAAR